MLNLKNIPIARKIWGGFTVVLALLCVLGGVAWWSLNGAGSNFTTYRSLAREANEIGRVQANMLYTRIGVFGFLRTGSDESVEAVRERSAAALSYVDSTEDLVTDPVRSGQLDTMRTMIQDYVAGFESILPLAARRNELVATMDSLGPTMEQSLTEVMRSAMEDGDVEAEYEAALTLRNLMLLRLYAYRFLQTNDESAFARVEQETSSFRDNAATLLGSLQNRQRRQLATQVVEDAERYHAAVSEVHSVIVERNAIINDGLGVIGPQVADMIETFKLEVKAEQDELGPQAVAAVETSILVAVVVAVVALVLGLLSAIFIGRGITRPIGAMTKAMGQLAEGDTTVEIPAQDHKDEAGAMARAVQVFKESLIRNDTAAKEKAEQEKREQRAQRVSEMLQTFEVEVGDNVEAVSTASAQMTSTANGLSSIADEASSQATAVAAASEEASSNVQTVAAAAEQLGASIQEISRQVRDQTAMAGKASETAERTNDQVARLDTAAREIGEVIQLITTIAEQTNLLALNATIEAARAGDAGKGFAVVASEVKNLANQTGKATETIASQIALIQSTTGETVQAIGDISEQIRQMNEISGAVAAAVEEQNTSTHEISRNVQEAAAGTRDVSSNISGVTHAAQETGRSATEVLEAAEDLSQRSVALRTMVQTFLSDIRAA